MARFDKLAKQLLRIAAVSLVLAVVLVNVSSMIGLNRDIYKSDYVNKHAARSQSPGSGSGRTASPGLTENSMHEKVNYTDPYHSYDGIVDLRIIVMTYNRPGSLNKTLNSLQGFLTDGFDVSLEIWIDKGADATEVDPETLEVASDFRWTNGPAKVWIHTRHVGIIGQWIYTWRPRVNGGVVDTREWALFVEDDVDISRYGYRWLRAVHKQYEARGDVACYTLQDVNAIGSEGRYKGKEIRKPKSSPVFFHRLPGSWGMAPHPQKWRDFQDWFEVYKRNDTFNPYVKAAPLPTDWYKLFQKQHREDSMWTMWYIYYTSERNEFCGYANLPTYTGKKGMSIASNRKEPGLHFPKRRPGKKINVPALLDSWKDDYVNFPKVPPIYDFTGKRLRSKSDLKSI